MKEFVHERISTDAQKQFCYTERTSHVPAVDLGIPAPERAAQSHPTGFDHTSFPWPR